jgi:DNA helicase-2/ATP-dependent DNA helicase PcrA
MAVLKSHSRSFSRPAPFIPDDPQRQAIEHVHGPMLVVAGAGTGKTSVLTNRIARLVEGGHARPEEILALTYTKNAATEMRDRVRGLLGGKEIHAATFHDFCNDLLARAGREFGVLDDTDLWIFLRRRIRELRLEYFVRAANVGQFLKDLLEFRSRCHDELVTPESYAEYVQQLERGELPIPRVAKSKNQLSDAEVLGRCQEIARVFATTERWLLEDNLGTFSHMITRAHALLESNKDLLAVERERARFILVDEFQDANFAQVKILAALAGQEGNIFAVGDPDQAIYHFRGASSAAFELFRRQFPAPGLVVLGKNWRSTTPILRSAFALIDKNPPVFATNTNGAIAYRRTPLQSAREEKASAEGKPLPSPPVAVVSFAGKDAEGPDVVSVIRELRAKLRCKWSDFGVLYRSHGHRDDVLRELAEANIPFAVESMDVSDTPQVRDLFACLGAVASTGDDINLFRVAALSQFDVDPQQLRAAMRTIAKESKDGRVVSLASVLDGVAGGPAVIESLKAAREEIRRTEAKGRGALMIIAKRFALDTGSSLLQAALKFIDEWEKKPLTETGELTEFIEYLRDFREAGGVIPMVSDESENAVRLMTVHLAKGLEFPHVFILRANRGSFPCSYRETLVEFPNELRDPDSAAEDDDRTLHDQEERRLFYVATTRARDSLHVYAKQGTGKEKTPAGLMRELLQNNSLRAWLGSRPARGSQTTIDIFAAASLAYPAASRTAEWLDLPPVESLHTRLSASAVDTYERCPLQFKLERDWRMARELPAAMQYGAAMHRVLRTYHDALRLGRPKTDEELIDLFREDLASLGIQEQYQHELYEKQGTAQLQDFLVAARSATALQVLHTEEGFEIRVGNTIVVGRIDRIDRYADGTVAIVDYKTGRARDQEDADNSLQLSLYAIAAREKWGYDVGSLVFYNLEDNVAVSTRRSESQLREACDRVEAAAQGIAAGNFKPKVDFHCAFCSYRSLCPAKEKRIPNRVAGAKSLN